jgi:hypothetical protein
MFDPLTAELEALVEAHPSAATIARLEALRGEPLTSAQRMLVAKAWDRAAAYVQAGFTAATVDATAPTRGGLPVPLLETELALMLRRSEPALLHHLCQARRYADELPCAFGLLAAGEIQIEHLRALEDLTGALSAQQACEVDAQIAARATTMTVSAFRRLVRRTVAAIDPDALRRRHHAAKQRAGVQLRPEDDGMASLRAFLPADQAITAMDALNARADQQRSPDDPRTHGQRQIHALLDALTGHTRPAEPATADGPCGRRVLRRRRAEIGVVISWADLLGLRAGVGVLDRFGPVPAQMVRDLITDPDTTSVLRRIVYDELTGDLLDYTATGYTPDTRLRDLLAVRDQTCRWPGCTRPAASCDADHRHPQTHGGATSTTNLTLLCRRHHNRKTHDGYTYDQLTDSTGLDELFFTTPLGFTYVNTQPRWDDTGPDTGDTHPATDPPTPPPTPPTPTAPPADHPDEPPF